MSKQVRCPNPGCVQIFSTAAMAPGSRYQCPACGTQFVFQAPSPTPQTNLPASPKPAQPTEPSLPQANPARLPLPREIPFIPLLGALVGTLLLGFLVLVGFRILEQRRASRGDQFPSGNYQLNKKEGWSRDESTSQFMGADMVYLEARTEDRLALISLDFRDRNPSRRELLNLTLEKLRKVFPEKLDYERKAELDQPLQEVDFQAFEFVGKTSDGKELAGEFHTGASKGIGYSLIFWGPSQTGPEAQSVRREVRLGFQFLEGRNDWQPVAVNTEAVQGEGWTLKLNPRFWRKDEIPAELKETNPGAVARIEGKLPGRKAFAGEMAEAYVIVLDKSPDLAKAMESAKAYLANLEKPVDESKITLEPTPNQEGEEVNLEVTNQGLAQNLRLFRLLAAGEANRVFVVQCGNTTDKTVFLAVSCPIGARKLWEDEMFRLAEGFALGKP